MTMQKVLMILTSHRLDCFNLCMDCLITGGSINDFDRVVLLLNGVTTRHQRYIDKLRHRHPEIPWDTISGPRGKGRYISGLQNQCVERYPNALYFKIDEDTFVSADWHKGLFNAYQQFKNNDDLSLITPVIPNNALGFYFLLNRFPELRSEYDRLFKRPFTPNCDGPVWLYPQIASWIMQQFISMAPANDKLRQHPGGTIASPSPITDASLQFENYTHLTYDKRFSINCICYDFRHWQEIGGVPEQDEVGWGEWIRKNNKRVYLCTDYLVHHYSFFVQQNWLDRTSLLEDLRASNTFSSRCSSMWPRLVRTTRQIPEFLHTKISSWAHRDSTS